MQAGEGEQIKPIKCQNFLKVIANSAVWMQNHMHKIPSNDNLA